MPAVVYVAPYLDRSARVLCADTDCGGLDATCDRTGPAQELARAHNAEHHPLSVLFTEPKEP